MLQPNKKIKVLYIQAPPGGGSVIALCEMLKKIDPQVIEPLVLCYYKTPHTQLLEKASRGKITYLFPAYITNLKSVSKFGGISPLSKLWRMVENEYVAFKNYYFPQNNLLPKITAVIKSFSPDVIHHNNDISAEREAVRVCGAFNIPQVIHNRSMVAYKNFSAGYLIDSKLHKKTAYTINITQAVGAYYNKLFPVKSEKALVLHDFVDAEKFHPTLPSSSLLKEFGLQQSDFIIADVGRLIHWKGQHVLIEALNIIKNKATNIKALIVGPYDKGVGSEDYFKHLQNLVEKYGLQGSVIFTGNRDDVPEIINVCQAVVHTAIKPEPQGLIIIEGLLCKKMVIAANAGGSAEIVNKYGGTLVTPGDAQQLADAIFECLKPATQQKMVSEIRYDILLDDFNGDKQMEQILNIYRSVINNKHPHNN